jgi:hypothetical protein
MITPKAGEHPLATKLRQLHLELFRAYALLTFTGFGIAFAVICSGHPLLSIAFVVVSWGFAVLARLEWRWSR